MLFEKQINKKDVHSLIEGNRDTNYSDLLGLPDGPVVKAPCFYCRGHGFNPWSGN